MVEGPPLSWAALSLRKFNLGENPNINLENVANKFLIVLDKL